MNVEWEDQVAAAHMVVREAPSRKAQEVDTLLVECARILEGQDRLKGCNLAGWCPQPSDKVDTSTVVYPSN